jgi:tRNA (guanine37-N1)-methyltransferase
MHFYSISLLVLIDYNLVGMTNISKITVLTLFPEYFESVMSSSMLKRAVESKAIEFEVINIREFASDKHRTTDDRPFGGGPGMVMKLQPIYAALESLAAGPHFRKPGEKELTILTSAKGGLFTQQTAIEWSSYERLTIICGHYEGVDERVAEHLIDREVRIGDYVLTGGEPAAAVMMDAVTRLVPGVLGNEESTSDESHGVPGVLGFPQYTRPEEFHGWTVPDVLIQGHHRHIQDWRQAQKRKS